MDDKKAFFYTLSIKPQIPLGVSCSLGEWIEYFSTRKKLENWLNSHPEYKDTSTFGMGEISIKCAKELIAISKKPKKRPVCFECGR